MATRTETALTALRAAIIAKLGEYQERVDEANARADAAEAALAQADLDGATALDSMKNELEGA